MAQDFKTKAQQYEDMLVRGEADEENGAAELPVQWQQAIAEVRGAGSAAAATAEEKPTPNPSPAVPDMVALMVLKADATSKDASFAEAVIDRTVQFGQPYPAVTHVELWIGERPGELAEDNHFSTYLGAKKGALWTSGLSDSKKFYSSRNR